MWIVDRKAREGRDEGLQIFEGSSTRSRSVLSPLENTGEQEREPSTFEKHSLAPKVPKEQQLLYFFESSMCADTRLAWRFIGMTS